MSKRTGGKKAGAFGTRAHNLGFDHSEIRSPKDCKRPSRPVKVEIKPGLIVYAKAGTRPSAVRKKYARYAAK
jgi:hypothetical protein